jgi:hypothetical protein
MVTVQEAVTLDEWGKIHQQYHGPPGMSREGDMLGKPTNLKFMDQDIIDEQTVQSWLGTNTHVLSAYRMQGLTLFPT